MTSSPSHSSVADRPGGVHARTALVLGGGGAAGNAWLIGVVAGLLDTGLDVTAADLVIGTSAGSTTAAQITGASPADLYDDTLRAGEGRPPGSARASGSRPPRVPNSSHTDPLSALIAMSADVADLRRRLGSAAIERERAAGADVSARWRATVATRLPVTAWPTQRLLITAVNARTGDPVIFDRDSGVEIVDAVAASCASSVAYRIGDDLYIDGGYRSNAENADLATGCERVLVLSPFGGRSLRPREWGTDLETQIDRLRADGSRVELMAPDDDVRAIFAAGGNVLSPATRLPAASSGFRQGRAAAARIRDFLALSAPGEAFRTDDLT